jgi:hypothetical protein
MNLKIARFFGWRTIKFNSFDQTVKELEQTLGISLLNHIPGTHIRLKRKIYVFKVFNLDYLDEQIDSSSLLQYLKRKFQSNSNDLTLLKFGYGQVRAF